MSNTFLGPDGLKRVLEKINMLKADIKSPSFTGIPTAPTPNAHDSSNQIATTAYVNAAIQNTSVKEKNIPVIYINGTLPTNKTDVICSFKYESIEENFDAYVKIKLQGTSSLNYPKKNFTIKLYSNAECTQPLTKNFKNWGEQQKFCLKANWMDFSHARNICGARLWSDLVASRDDYDTLPEELRNSPNNGAIDGFPILVYCNNVYQGRYTLNIPKGDWMFGMNSSSEEQCILSGENYVSGTFRKTAQINGADWSDELHDTCPDALKNRWNEVITFVMNSEDEEFKTNLSNYFDVNSLIDYFLFSYVTCNLDGLAKNQIFITYDGGAHWIASAYDLDTTMGIYWDGSSFVSTSYRMQQDYETAVNGNTNLLYDRLKFNFWEELKARWAVVSQTVLNPYHMIKIFENFRAESDLSIIAEDYDSYTGNGKFTKMPSTNVNHFSQIRNYIANRFDYVTAQMKMALTYTIKTLRENYSPAGEIYKDTGININMLSGGSIEAKIILKDCSNESNWENIFSLGKDISVWKGSEAYHIYYQQSTKKLQLNRVQSDIYGQGYERAEITLTDDQIANGFVLMINSDGAHIDGNLVFRGSATLNSLANYQAGACQGETLSQATYGYVKVSIPQETSSTENTIEETSTDTNSIIFDN